jgi:site-specific DNA recombinase
MAELKNDKIDVEVTFDEEKTLNKRIDTFRKIFERNKSPDEFDPTAFKSIVEKVIVGDVDENGNKNPYMITFVFKTGLKADADCSGRKISSTSKKTCSHSVHDTSCMWKHNNV